MRIKFFFNTIVSFVVLLLTLLFSAHIASAQNICSHLFATKPSLSVFVNYSKIIDDIIKNKVTSEYKNHVSQIKNNQKLQSELIKKIHQLLNYENSNIIESESAAQVLHGLYLLSEIDTDHTVNLISNFLNSSNSKVSFFTKKSVKKFVTELNSNIPSFIIFQLIKNPLSKKSFQSVMQIIVNHKKYYESYLQSIDFFKNISLQLKTIKSKNDILNEEDFNILNQILDSSFSSQLIKLADSKNVILKNSPRLYLYNQEWANLVNMAFYLRELAENSQIPDAAAYYENILNLLVEDLRIYRNNRLYLSNEVRSTLDLKF